MNVTEIAIKQRRLPHWRVEDGTYFVTCHLADSLPEHVLKELAAQPLPYGTDPDAWKRRRARVEKALDAGYGSCVLKDDRCAAIVQGVIEKFAGTRYQLGPWTVMPNHIHNVVRPMKGHTLDEVVGDWKSVSAHRINKLLGTKGRLWQPEMFDSWLRDENELRRVRLYILENPVKAKLRDWKWVDDVDTTGLIVKTGLE